MFVLGSTFALRARACCIALLAAVLLAGCGDRAASPPTSTATSTDGAAMVKGARSRTETSSTTPADSSDGDAERDADAQPPTAAAIALGARLDRLEAEFAPVSSRINYLVAAETLRRDAVESGATSDVTNERFGAVRLEIRRMEPILAAAKQRVAAVQVNGVAERRVQQLLLASIAHRTRALAQLEAVLNAATNPEVGDTKREQLADAWRISWNASLRATRDATTLVQDTRAAARLEPAPEEALR